MKPKKELLRIVRSKEGEIGFDSTGKAAGRGAYLCSQQSCLEKAMKARLLERALEHPVSTEVYEQLRRELENRENNI